MVEFKKLIEFDLLNPQGMIETFEPDFDLKETLFGMKQQLLVSEDQKASMFDDLTVYIMLLTGGLLILFFVALIYVICTRFKDKVK